MSGSEQRIRHDHIGARVTSKEKQQFHDLMTGLGFQSEGDLIRYVFFGTLPFKMIKYTRKFTSYATFAVRVVASADGTLTREVSK